MTLNSFVRQIDAASDFLPTKNPTPGCPLSTIEGNRAGAFPQAGCWSVRCDEPLIDDDAIIESSEGIHDSGIFFINQVLAAVLELKFVGMVGLQGQIDDAA